nr:MAG TPA: hypothetical protein [Caudoviricetes sp.]
MVRASESEFHRQPTSSRNSRYTFFEKSKLGTVSSNNLFQSF